MHDRMKMAEANCCFNIVNSINGIVHKFYRLILTKPKNSSIALFISASTLYLNVSLRFKTRYADFLHTPSVHLSLI